MGVKLGLRSLNLKRAYSSDDDDLLNDFYIPVLEKSIEYNRLAGFFSSTSLAISARGVTGLIRNDGKMRIIVSPKINQADIYIIEQAIKSPEQVIQEKMLLELEDLENEFVKDHVFALGWMLANHKIDIKVAIARDDYGSLLIANQIQQVGLFHQKVGIFKDSEGNIVTFSGSVNETAMGWTGNIEEFKVFQNIYEDQKEYVDADVSKFERYWNNKSKNLNVVDLPSAVKSKLIDIAPNDFDKINLEKWSKKKNKVQLFETQEKAIDAWFNNGRKGIFEMATGTGKTFTSLGCLDKLTNIESNFLTIITCPYQHLVQQWKRELDNFGIEYDKLIIADSSNHKWKSELVDTLQNMHIDSIMKTSENSNNIVITTHTTFSSKDFKSIVEDYKNNLEFFLIADEVHGIGAAFNKKGMLPAYNWRLGLSATPERWFDEIGTKEIYEFFDKIVYKLDLEDAINTINPATSEPYLTRYRYIPKFVPLQDDELEEYIQKSKSIAVKYANQKKQAEKDKILEALLFRRADIIKNAKNKYSVLEKVLDEIQDDLIHTIIYCTSEQMIPVLSIIKKRKIIAHQFTMNENPGPVKEYNGKSEREYILEKFADGSYQVLIAMKCLDEGVDVPPAKRAILMASSGNPREYIQRIGRVIRRYPSKKEATIYDIIIRPTFDYLPPNIKEIEMKIFEKELRRCEEIATIATNSAEALKMIYAIKVKCMGDTLWRTSK
ncbi:superfamily II DNA or RNA helicase [Methanohalophilus euhalobius]|uniref:Superfamily II DNA or RNA helicase n=1 Tax=Methanohalophilus euhalobius TaxID=51203 RepID=A0A285F493_9EURY|nr:MULTISPECIES: DEAD/DEAH box helicase family protein [Methanohalophilus]ODV49942.1 MAG: DNA phosphorothioation system restriction enzyme [Methanohalophilus sp. 2-GBenrich]RXG34878.1 DNA phosphorothioation system restriction enzyme [Methanohalophilus sp. WG1-DM]TCL12361.1 superfamily II DNA or RNA helicase [Methanohalophilus euhalobius]SNY06117.1 Superfamily II DNA or RNA helicase [Methanohalophilus euhalobius]